MAVVNDQAPPLAPELHAVEAALRPALAKRNVTLVNGLATRVVIEEGRAVGVQVDRGGVSLPLEPAELMRANLTLRTASRMLLRLGTFPAASPEMLYDRARKLPWEVHLGFATSYALRITARNSKLQAGDEVARTVASAVSRHMRELGLYPKPAEEAALEFHVRLLNDYCTISLDTSGELLHRRFGTRPGAGGGMGDAGRARHVDKVLKQLSPRSQLALCFFMDGDVTEGHQPSGHTSRSSFNR